MQSPNYRWKHLRDDLVNWEQFLDLTTPVPSSSTVLTTTMLKPDKPKIPRYVWHVYTMIDWLYYNVSNTFTLAHAQHSPTQDTHSLHITLKEAVYKMGKDVCSTYENITIYLYMFVPTVLYDHVHLPVKTSLHTCTPFTYVYTCLFYSLPLYHKYLHLHRTYLFTCMKPV